MKTAYNYFHNLFGDLLIDLGFTPSRAYQDKWLRKLDKFNGYDFIVTHVDNIFSAVNNPSKYINEIEKTFKCAILKIHQTNI